MSTIQRLELANAWVEHRFKDIEAFINSGAEFTTHFKLNILSFAFLKNAEIGNRTWLELEMNH